MENELLGIGAMARVSGLPVSALRFYDGAGVLRPTLVDPSSGYRFYGSDQVKEARLVVHLRRVGLPLDDIRAVLADPVAARPILASHLARLEAGLVDARREISMAQHLIETTENTMHRLTLPASDVVRALREIRYAVLSASDDPRLSGIFLDGEVDHLRLVATDRYRLATTVLTTTAAAGFQVLLPVAAVDELLDAGLSGELDIVVAEGVITVTDGRTTVRAEIPDVDYPAYESLIGRPRREVTFDAAALRAELASGATETLTRDEDGGAYDVSRISLTESGVRVGSSDEPGSVEVAVNRDFLIDALQAGGQLTLGLDEPIAPLAIRDPERDGVVSILMPVRLDQPA